MIRNGATLDARIAEEIALWRESSERKHNGTGWSEIQYQPGYHGTRVRVVYGLRSIDYVREPRYIRPCWTIAYYHGNGRFHYTGSTIGRTKAQTLAFLIRHRQQWG